jgi:hypothetical protein
MFSDWDYAIRRESSAGTVSVNGNSFRNIGTAVMTNDAAVVKTDGWIVGNNTYSDCTRISDASPNLPSFPILASAATVSVVDFASVIRITGTTQIDDINIATVPMGVPFTLLFTSAVTVSNTGNINLSGSTSQGFTANSALTLVSDGTAIYEISRTVQ